MFARFGAKFLVLVAAAAMVFFGVGLLGLALAAALVTQLGTAGAYALTGGILLLIVLAGMGINAMMRPRLPPPPPPGLASLLLGALGRDVPWAAVISAGVAGLADMMLRRRNPPAK